MTENPIGSQLPEAHERFVAKYLERLKRSGLITPDMLYETFTPERLYDGYKDEVTSRGKILELTGRLTAEYAGAFDRSAFSQIVSAAVKIGDIKRDKLFATVSSDELVRVHDRKELYALMELTAWFDKDTPEHREIAAHLLTDYLKEELGGGRIRSLRDLEEIFGFELYVKHLPSEILVAILKSARGVADAQPGNVAFTADVLAETVTADVLAKHMPLELVQKLVESAAMKFGYKDKPKPIEVPKPPPSESEGRPSGSMGIPPEVLVDSVPPPPPTDPPKAESDDPEVAISSGGDGGAVDLELDDMLEADAKKDGEKKPDDRPGLTDDDGTADEPTMVVSAADVERQKKGKDKDKPKGPPPLHKNR